MFWTVEFNIFIKCMIVYNVTINIDSAVHDEWLKWDAIDDAYPGGIKDGNVCKEFHVESNFWRWRIRRTYLFCAIFQKREHFNGKEYACISRDKFNQIQRPVCRFVPCLRWFNDSFFSHAHFVQWNDDRFCSCYTSGGRKIPKKMTAAGLSLHSS